MIRSKHDFSLTPKKGCKNGNLYRHGQKNLIYCRFFHTANGKKVEVRQSTDSTTEKDAKTVAWVIYLQATGRAKEGETPNKPVRNTSPKIGRVTQFLTENRSRCCNRASASSVLGYVQALSRAIELVDPKTDWKNANVSILNDEFVYKWRAAKYRERKLDINEPADVDPYFNANINSEWNNAKAVFGKKAVLAYQDAGMHMPPQLFRMLAVPRMPQEVDGFTEIPAAIDMQMQICAQAAIHRARGLDYQVPEGAGWEVPTAKVAVVYEMARFCALTQKEIAHAWRGWLSADLKSLNVGPYQDSKGVNFVTKMNAKNGSIPLNPQRVQWWLDILGTEGEYLLPGEYKTQRTNLCSREANPWIGKFFGTDRKKRLHDLRKQAGSDVYKASASLTAAAAFIRDNEETARKYYLPKGHNSAQFGVVGL
ncbi:MAG: hypothetical protein ACSHX4_03935 [Opitutaceae bacterium]